jgi:hypothetical protein
MNALAPPDLPDARARVQTLRDPLLAELGHRPAATRAPARRLRPAWLAAVATLALAGVLTASIATTGPTSALAVDRQDGWLVLRITDVSAGAERLTEELRDAGISGEVRLLPVAAADVGTWTVVSEFADPPGTPRPPIGAPQEETVRLASVERSRDTLRIPIATVRESTGYFVFYAGREARSGEPLMRDGKYRFAP